LVQRFGRCARYGGDGHVVVLDRGEDEPAARPYDAVEIEAVREVITSVLARGVGVASLAEFEAGLDLSALSRLYPYQPRHLIIRREFDDLFDTTPDLTGADIDISRFVRSSDDRDLQVFWTPVPKPTKQESPVPPPDRQPLRDELCAVPFLAARDWLCGKESKGASKRKLLPGVRAWVWDWLEGEWVIADRAALVPGRIVCVSSDTGGYLPERGFAPEERKRHVEPIITVEDSPAAADPSVQADVNANADAFSLGEWKTIAAHADEVVQQVMLLATGVGVSDEVRDALVTAAKWHDIGKAHPVFQESIRSPQRPLRKDLAKAPRAAWVSPSRMYRLEDGSDSRPGFRHELASALALFAVLIRCAPEHPALLGTWGEALALMGHEAGRGPTTLPSPSEEELLGLPASQFDLVAYLVASHHGKVRASLDAAPKDQDYVDRDGKGLPIRGVREGDTLPAVVLSRGSLPVPALTLTLQPAALGLSPVTGRSWRERSTGLMRRFGPAGLAFLEALLIAADRHASRSSTADPSLYREDGTR